VGPSHKGIEDGEAATRFGG